MQARAPLSSAVRRLLVAGVLVAALTGLLAGPLVRPASAVADTDAGLFEITNRERNAHGLAPLAWDPAAAAIARTWSASMSLTQVLAHNPNLTALVTSQVTSQWRRIGENVGVGGSIDSLHRAFMNSSGHRANILGDYNRLGTGVVRAVNGQLWVTLVFLYGPSLSGTTPPPTTQPAPPPSTDRDVSAAVRDDGRLEMAERSSSGAVQLRTQRNGQWSGWQNLGGVTGKAPDLSSWGNDRLDLFVIGTDGALWHRAQQGNSWSPWESLGGALTSAPSAVSWGAGRIDVIARGRDGAVWARSYDGGWGGWYRLGGQVAHAPEIASWAPGRLDIFAVGTDSQMWHMARVGGGFTGWEALGGRFTSAPAVTAPAAGRLDVFGRGADNSTWSLSWTGWWTGWWWMGGVSRSAPEAASTPAGSVHVFVEGQDGRTWLRTRGGSWSPWSLLG